MKRRDTRTWVGLGFLLSAALVLPASCGGKAVLDGESSGTSTASGNGEGCDDHDDCLDGSLCRFSTGACRVRCDEQCAPCPTGQECVACATSSCRHCDDCQPLCVPIAAGSNRCDDHSDCADDELCIFNSNTCRPRCDSVRCTDAQFCDTQATLNDRCGMVLLDACSP